MTAADRDLVTALRAELAGIDPSRPCDRAAERAGLGVVRVARDPVLARLALRLGLRGPAADRRELAAEPPPAIDFPSLPEHCRMAYLRGRFLARGSLSLAGGRTHLEFVVDAAEAPVLAEWLSLAELPASWRIRRGRGVVTWKGAETVGLFLRRIGAGAALLELEARQVSRALRGELNRVLNAESANLQRSVAAAGRQLAAIDLLESDGRLGEQPYVVRVVAAARRETPEATLSELAERLGLHRSAVQRALDRLERLALHGEAPAAPLA
ncbi:MAG TPA: DNA-binding protein WhiA [Candidatus Limnocylindrales bacterium]|nr:DNA-binding protein WhiA [Candidatus Limnocylindrales bacterium]